MSFYDRYQALCLAKGIQPASQSSADALGCTSSNISILAKNGKTPNGDIVANAAKMLNVSADYLLGLTDIPRSLESYKTDNPETEEEIINKLKTLNSDALIAVDAMVNGLSDEPAYRKMR